MSGYRQSMIECLEDRMLFAGGPDLSTVFALSSLPGALHTIYLDFNGHTTVNTKWNTTEFSDVARPSIITPAYDTDGNTASFSDTERTNIYNIWQRVAEDYAPFQVNVTTLEPPLASLIKSNVSDLAWGIRVVIGGSDFDGNRAGAAIVNSFNYNTDTPCFIFSDNLVNGREEFVAEAISHEVGHTLGLGHDGQGDTEYYTGHGSGATSWAPIMGSAYTAAVSQWSKGEYTDASNTQDDLALITTRNGFGYRPDDTGNTIGAARALQQSGNDWQASGLIERNTDFDVFSFTTPGGAHTFRVDPAPRGPNLDILAELLNSSGQVISSHNPADTLGVTFNANLALGTYYLRISGAAHPNGVYTAYGSLGQYSIAATVVPSYPEVAVTGNGSNIADGSANPASGNHTLFGSVAAGSTISRTFRVSNLGEGTLVTSNLTLPAGFTLVEGLSPVIAPGGFDEFTVRLDAAAAGTYAGDIRFNNNDQDENPFNFRISGTVLGPEIAVFGNGPIEDGDATPSTAGHTDFGVVIHGGTPVTRSFTVSNTGNAALTTSNLSVPPGFFVVEGLSASIAPGASDTFSIRLRSGWAGTFTGQVSFNNNDTDENPFNFTITGKVIPAPAPRPQSSDFNWDGNDDVVYYNSDTGRIVAQLLGAQAQPTGETLILRRLPGPTWHVAAVADFDQDGSADLLIRDRESGANRVWYFINGAFASARVLPRLGPAFRVAGAADFSGDGRPDVVWQRTATRQHAIWSIHDQVEAVAATLPVNRAVETVGAADFTGDGQSDLLIRNRTTGESYVWAMQGAAFRQGMRLPDAPPAWRVGDVRDLDRDGVADILWRHDSGRQTTWFMRGNGTIKANQPLAGFIHNSWFPPLATMTGSLFEAAAASNAPLVDTLAEAPAILPIAPAWRA